MLKKISNAFKKLKRKSYGDVSCPDCKGNDSDAIECTICLDHIHKNNKTLNCGHAFHISCIDNWLAVNSVCPNCRRNPNEPLRVEPPILPKRANSAIQDLGNTYFTFNVFFKLTILNSCVGGFTHNRFCELSFSSVAFVMCSDFLVETIDAQKDLCKSDKNAEKKVEIGCDKLSEEDFEYLANRNYCVNITFDLTCLRFDPRVYAGYERDSCNERWVITWEDGIK